MKDVPTLSREASLRRKSVTPKPSPSASARQPGTAAKKGAPELAWRRRSHAASCESIVGVMASVRSTVVGPCSATPPLSNGTKRP